MTGSTDRILTTHAGSLPRPDDLADMIWAEMDGEPVDHAALAERTNSAVAEVVARQRQVGIDIVSDGEQSKQGFSTYINDRFTGFGGRVEFQADDVAEFPTVAPRIFKAATGAHMLSRKCVGPVQLSDRQAVLDDVARLRAALGTSDPSTAFVGAISPGQVAYQFPNDYYPSHEEYLAAITDALRYEYRAIIDAGFNLQVDSPDLAMAAHSRHTGSSVGDWRAHLPLAIEALNAALEGIAPERVRLHVCWGNYGGPHHRDVPLESIIEEILKARVGMIYPEGANPRHEHEWRVFEQVALPDDMSVILGVIDVKSNCIEHPRVVADRIVRLARIIGRERVLAGTDCGFDTFIRFSLVDSEIAWQKLGSLVDGAKIASDELW